MQGFAAKILIPLPKLVLHQTFTCKTARIERE